MACWQVNPHGFIIHPSGSTPRSISQFRPAIRRELQEVEAYYNICPVPGHVIDTVQVMYNPLFESSFKHRLAWLQSRSPGGFFQKKLWENDPEIAKMDARVPGKTPGEGKKLRGVVSDLFSQMSQKDPQYPDLDLIPLWHATGRAVVGSLAETGFYAAASIDAGFFGRGIYFTPDASYSYGVYGPFHRNPVLLLSWVATYAVYPVMEWENLMGASQKTKHDAHFVLVRRRTPDLADSNYDAQAPDVQNDYSEVVMFDEEACLPRYVVTLKPSTTPDPGEFAFREGQRHQTTAPLLALYHFKRAFHCYKHAPSRGAIDGLLHRYPHYADLWQPFTSRLMPLVKELEQQLLHSNIDKFKEGLEAFSYTLNRAEEAQPYLELAEKLEAFAVGPGKARSMLRSLPPQFKALLLACWNRCLLMLFLQTHGTVQPIAPQTWNALQSLLISAQTPESSALHEEMAFLSNTVGLFEYQNKNPNDPSLVPMAQKLHNLVTMAVNPNQWTQTLDQLDELYTRHPFFTQDHRGLVLLLRALRTNSKVCTLEPVITWVQRRVGFEVKVGQANPNLAPCHWLLSLTTLQFLLTSLKNLPMDLAETVLLGDKNVVGLRHWIENLLVLEKKSLSKAWCIEVLSGHEFLTQYFVDRTEPLFHALKTNQWKFLNTFEMLHGDSDPRLVYDGQRLLVQYKSLKNSKDLPLTWQDYVELGHKSQGINPSATTKSYEQAKALLGTDSKSQDSLRGVCGTLSRLYLEEGKKLEPQNKIFALKAYLRSLQEYTVALNQTLDSPALPALVQTALPLGPNEWLIRTRLSTFARPLKPEESVQFLVKAGHTVLNGIFSGAWVIEKNSRAQKQLFDGDHIRPANFTLDAKGKTQQEGRHRVACIGQEFNQLHMKENPSCPGLAFGAWSFAYLLLNFHKTMIPTGLVPVEPFKIQHLTSQGVQDFYLQASPTVYGSNFKNVLNQGTDLHSLHHLALGALTLVTFLLDLEDARAANFMVEMDGQKPTRLVSVDNDHVWVRNDVFEEGLLGKIRPRVKNILYCMPHMNDVIPADVKEIFLALPFSSLEFFKIWLFSLVFYNQSLMKIFSKQEMARLFDSPEDKDKVMLEAYFHPEHLGRLYIKSMQLRDKLVKPQETYLGLLVSLQPRLGGLYQGVWKDKPLATTKERFGTLTSGLFDSLGGTKTTNTQLVQMILNKTVKNYQEFADHKTSPQELIPFLHSFIGTLHQEEVVVQLILQNIQTGNINLFREQEGRGQAHVLRRMDWKSMSPNVLTPAFHQQFLAAIDSNLEEITFKNHPLLTDDDVIDLLMRLKAPQTLVIEECPRVLGLPRPGGGMTLSKQPDPKRISLSGSLLNQTQQLAVGIAGGILQDAGNLLDSAVQIKEVFVKRSLVYLCHIKNINKITLIGKDLTEVVLYDLEKYYGPKPQSEIRFFNASWPYTANGMVKPMIQIQSVAWTYPQWGLPLQLPAVSQAYLPLEKPLPTHSDRLHHNFEMLLRSGWLRPEQVPLLLSPGLKTLDVHGIVLKEDIKQAILKHCPQVRLVGEA